MKHLCLLALVFALHIQLQAQNTTISPTIFSPPKLSYEAVLALSSPQEGDVVYDITFKCLRVYMDGKWLCSYQDPSNYTPNLLAIASAGGTGVDEARSIAVDGNGNVYVTGYFEGTATFGNVTKTSAGYRDIFVAKYDKSGSVQWVQSAGGTSNDFGSGIAVDGNGNVYVTGYFYDTATFGNISKTSAGDTEIFVVKYNAAGTFQWVETAGGTFSDAGYDITVDGSGNVYVTGYFSDTATFGTASKSSAGANDTFVAKYNAAGMLLWVQSIGGTDGDSGQQVAVDGSGNVYVTGSFGGTANFGTITKTAAGTYDMFVAKYDPVAEVWRWVQTVGHTGISIGRAIALDGSGNVYVTGYFENTVTFGTTSKISAGSSDIFVVKYSTTGTMEWVQTAGGANFDQGYGIAVDGNSNVYVTGAFSGTATFGSTVKTSVGETDIFITKYNPSGTWQWTQFAGGTHLDYGNKIAIDSSNNVFITGFFYLTAKFGRNSKTSAGSREIFIGRLDK